MQDPIPRMRIFTPDGVEFLEVRDPAERSLVGEHWNAVRHYLNTGDDSRLWPLEGQTVEGKPVVTDLDAIDEEARRGEIEFEGIYES